jgi:hypothetical protein
MDGHGETSIPPYNFVAGGITICDASDNVCGVKSDTTICDASDNVCGVLRN